MVIETKFNIGDEVWTTNFKLSKLVKCKIEKIAIKVYSNPTNKICNTIEYLLDEDTFWYREENKLFKTKEELIASL